MRTSTGIPGRMRASYRWHRLRRSLTRTPILVAVAVGVTVLVFALDKSHQPAGCQFVKTYEGYGAYTARRICPKPGQTLKPHGLTSFRTEVALWLGAVLLIPTAVFLIPRVVRLRDDIAVRRERHR